MSSTGVLDKVTSSFLLIKFSKKGKNDAPISVRATSRARVADGRAVNDHIFLLRLWPLWIFQKHTEQDCDQTWCLNTIGLRGITPQGGGKTICLKELWMAFWR